MCLDFILHARRIDSHRKVGRSVTLAASTQHRKSDVEATHQNQHAASKIIEATQAELHASLDLFRYAGRIHEKARTEEWMQSASGLIDANATI